MSRVGRAFPRQAATCDCRECQALDCAHPGEGRQLALSVAKGSGAAARRPLPKPDAPAVATAGVSAPEGRPIGPTRKRPHHQEAARA